MVINISDMYQRSDIFLHSNVFVIFFCDSLIRKENFTINESHRFQIYDITSELRVFYPIFH